MTPGAQSTSRRPKHRLGAVLLIAAVASIVIAAQPAAGKTTTNPCALLTRAEIKQVYGGPVGKPTTDASGGCKWEVRGGSFEPQGRVVSTALENDVDTTFEQARAAAANSGGFLFVGHLGKDRRSGSGPCVGDCPGAIFYASPAGTIQVLWVRTADKAFVVGVKLPEPPAGAVETPEALPLNRDDPLASELARLERLAKRAKRRV